MAMDDQQCNQLVDDRPPAVEAITTWDEIVKSRSDRRLYRAIQLGNRMRILLVSDKLTNVAAVALDVGRGSRSDPVKGKGMAHWCEHLLFMGTKTDRGSANFDEFLASRGGASNGHTNSGHTNIHFSVSPEYLKEALERLHCMCTGPEFEENVVRQEIEVIDAEFRLRKSDPYRRFNQLQRHVSSSSSFYGRQFTNGNKTSLSKNGRSDVMEFFNSNYTPDVMALVVVGNQTLGELETLVCQLFSDLRPKNPGATMATEMNPFAPDRLPLLYLVKTEERPQLRMVFPVELDVINRQIQNPEATRVEQYMVRIFNETYSGSLQSVLVSKGWIVEMKTNYENAGHGYGFINIIYDLASNFIPGGQPALVQRVKNILSATFTFLKLLSTSNGSNQALYEKYEAYLNMEFEIKDKDDPMEYAVELSTRLRDFDWKNIGNVLKSPYMKTTYESEAISNFIGNLHPENMVCFAASSLPVPNASIEPLYGTEYIEVRIPQLDIVEVGTEDDAVTHSKDINAARIDPFKFKLPTNHDNKYVSQLPETAIRLDEGAKSELFKKISDGDRKCIFYKKDGIYGSYLTFTRFRFRSPFVNSTAANVVAARIFYYMLKEALGDDIAEGNAAGLKLNILNDYNGLTVTMVGLHDQQPILLHAVIVAVENFGKNNRGNDMVQFEAWKDFYISEFDQCKKEAPYELASFGLYSLVSGEEWANEQLKEAARGLSFEKLEEFISLWKKNFYIEGLIYGYTSEEDATTIVSALGSLLRCAEDGVKFNRKEPDPKRVDDDNGVRSLELNTEFHTDSAIGVFFEIMGAHGDSRLRLKVLLLEKLLSERFPSKLRMAEQFEYVTICEAQTEHYAQGIAFIVQTNRPLDHIENRIDTILEGLYTELNEGSNATKEKFSRILAVLMRAAESNASNLVGHCERFWSGVKYNRSFVEFLPDPAVDLILLKQIELGEVIQLMKDFMLLHGKDRKKTTVFVRAGSIQDKLALTLEKPLPCGKPTANIKWAKFRENVGPNPFGNAPRHPPGIGSDQATGTSEGPAQSDAAEMDAPDKETNAPSASSGHEVKPSSGHEVKQGFPGPN